MAIRERPRSVRLRWADRGIRAENWRRPFVCKLQLGSDQAAVSLCASCPLLLGFPPTRFVTFSVILTPGARRDLKCTHKCRLMLWEIQKDSDAARDQLCTCFSAWGRCGWRSVSTRPWKSPRRLFVYFSRYRVAGYWWSRLLQCAL